MSIVYRLIDREKYGPVRNAYARWEEAGLASRAEAVKVQTMSLVAQRRSSLCALVGLPTNSHTHAALLQTTGLYRLACVTTGSHRERESRDEFQTQVS